MPDLPAAAPRQRAPHPQRRAGLGDAGGGPGSREQCLFRWLLGLARRKGWSPAPQGARAQGPHAERSQPEQTHWALATPGEAGLRQEVPSQFPSDPAARHPALESPASHCLSQLLV